MEEFLKGHSDLKLEEITAFKREGMPLTGLNARGGGVDVMDYSQNAATVSAKWCQPATRSSATGRGHSLRAAG